MSPEARRAADEGSAVVEFVLVSVLVIALALGVIQLALALHARNMMASAASEGARLAATNDRDLADGVERTQWLLGQSLGGMPTEVTAEDTVIDGAPAVHVTVSGPVPLIGLWGVGSVHVSARAFKEVDRG